MSTETPMQIAMKAADKLVIEITEKHNIKHDPSEYSDTSIIPLLQTSQHIEEIKNITGSTTCPICQSTFNYRISRENGHIMGQCEKDKCLFIAQ